MNWIKCSEKMPPISFIESDNILDEYCAKFFMIYYTYCRNPEMAIVILEQNEDGELEWWQYITGEGGDWQELEGIEVTHWMELPKSP